MLCGARCLVTASFVQGFSAGVGKILLPLGICFYSLKGAFLQDSFLFELKNFSSSGTVGEKDQVAISRFEVSRVHVPEAPPHNFSLRT